MRRVVLVVAALLAVLPGCTGPDGPAGREVVRTPASAAPTSVAPAGTSRAASSATAPSCSGTQVDGELPVQAGLPEPVARLRAEIDAAARDCDLERLQALALAGDSAFTASFGDAALPAALWREQEAGGQAPLLRLRQVLRTSPARDGGSWVWPAAFARDSWQEVTAQERVELEALYGERDLRAFEEFGAYAGHRVVITPDGDWRAFVAGD